MSDPILGFFGPYRWLSNFHRVDVEYEGITYPSTENAYQAAKTLDLEARRQFVEITPAAAKALGRRVQIREGWDDLRLLVMSDLTLRKFAPGTALAADLLATGDRHLVEGNTWGDRFWGVCRGSGKNHLGKILMRTRFLLSLDRSADQP